jgi:hypothetical protein
MVERDFEVLIVGQNLTKNSISLETEFLYRLDALKGAEHQNICRD